MKKTLIIGAISTILLATVGCGSNRIVGSSLVQEGHWYGEVGITGSNNNITIQQPSELTKLSIIGNMNSVYVDDHVPLGKIEIWGRNNSISIPENLIIRTNQIGKETTITRRSAGGKWIRRTYVYEPDEGETLDSTPLRIRNEAASPDERGQASDYYAPPVNVEEQ